MFFKVEPVHQLCRPFRSAAENQASARAMDRIGKLFQSLETGGVDRRHIPEAKDNDGRKVVQAVKHLFEFLRCSEQEGTMDAEDRNVGRNRFILQYVEAAVLDVLG